MNIMKLYISILLGNSLLLTSFAKGVDIGQTTERPNILFIVVDDLRPELNCYGAGHIQSPNIDRLASEGTLFERAYCNIPVCGASRASLLTGLRPARKRFLDYQTRADLDAPGITTLPRHFRINGYYSISIGKVFHHGDDAVESWDEIWHAPSNSGSWLDYAMPENIPEDTSKFSFGPPLERAVLKDNVYMDGKIAEKVITDLRRMKETDTPFFLAAGFLKPHLPFNAPDRYWRLYDGKVNLPDNNFPPEYAPAESFHMFWELRAYAGVPYSGKLGDELALDLIHGYYACVSYTDAQIGKILDELKLLGLDKNTIVILIGDHGWSLREHGLWCKTSNYETSLHSPMILKIPGTTQVGSTTEIVEFVDIYPSLCELAGLELPEQLQGDSFKELLFDADATSDGVAICQWKDGLTTIQDQYFYTEWVNDEDSTYTRMLYDHVVDPAENFNISEKSENASILQDLSKEMRQSRGENYFLPVVPAGGQLEK